MTDTHPELIDQFGRNIGYLRLSVTDRCNFRCPYCRLPKGEEELSPTALTEDETVRLVHLFSELGIHHFRLTGGEPLLRRNLAQMVARMTNSPYVHEISLSTNAFFLPQQAKSLKQAGVGRVNISLDSLDPTTFDQLTRGGDLKQVLQGIDAALEAGLTPVKLNMVVMGGINDHEIGAMIRFARAKGVVLRFIEAMPIGEAGVSIMGQHVSTDQIVTQIQKAFPGELQPDIGPGGSGPARYFRISGLGANIGIISAVSKHFCATCNRVRLTSWGDLVLCLGQSHRLGLRDLLRNGLSDTELKQIIAAKIYKKPKSHTFNALSPSNDGFNMASLGG
ncbi:MAG: GTP 3',8-cyclase MoaA [Magnetococcus sp. DMHC-6]